MSDSVKLVTGPTDVERASDLKARSSKPLEELCRIMDDARKDGLVLNFNIATDNFGRHTVGSLTVVKPL